MLKLHTRLKTWTVFVARVNQPLAGMKRTAVNFFLKKLIYSLCYKAFFSSSLTKKHFDYGICPWKTFPALSNIWE